MSADETTNTAETLHDDDAVSGANTSGTAEQSRQRGLKPWKKGQSGNPKGKSASLAAIEKLIAQLHTPNAVHVIGVLYTLAMEGNVQAADIFLNRTIGKVEGRREPLAVAPSIDGATSEDARQHAIDALANQGARLAATSKARELSECEVRIAATIAQVTTAGLKADEELGKDSASKMTRDQMAEQMREQLRAWGKL